MTFNESETMKAEWDRIVEVVDGWNEGTREYLKTLTKAQIGDILIRFRFVYGDGVIKKRHEKDIMIENLLAISSELLQR